MPFHAARCLPLTALLILQLFYWTSVQDYIVGDRALIKKSRTNPHV
jgi:hypothetical protein